VFIKYCVFFLKILEFFWTLPVLLQRWCKREVRCTQSDTEGKQRKARVRNELKIFVKTQYFNNTLYENQGKFSSKYCNIVCHVPTPISFVMVKHTVPRGDFMQCEFNILLFIYRKKTFNIVFYQGGYVISVGLIFWVYAEHRVSL